MNRLVIDCATEACSVALFEGETCVAHDHRVLGRGHAEHLVPMIAALPDRGKADLIAVSRGPGSFTGVRIGIATARALGVAWKARVEGYPTLALVAAMAQSQFPWRPVRVVMTGGHGEWFVQDFEADGVASTVHASLGRDAVLALPPAERVAGSQARAYCELTRSGEPIELLPDAAAFAHLSASFLTSDTAPIYGRPPDAKVQKRG